MKIHQVFSFAILLGLSLGVSGEEVVYGTMRNGTFATLRTLRADDPGVAAMIKAKWVIPADLVFPTDWGPNPSTPGGTLEYHRTGGWEDSAFVRLDGGGHIMSYFGRLRPATPYIASLRVRGKGKVWFGSYEYGEHGQIGAATFVARTIDTNKWVEYRGLYSNTNVLLASINLALSGDGTVDVDQICFDPAEPADAEITREMVGLYGTGALIENPEIQAVRIDDAFKTRLAEYESAQIELRQNQARVDKTVFKSLEQKSAVLAPYIRGEGKNSVLTSYYNEMITLTRVLKRLAGAAPVAAAVATVEPISSSTSYKPGERAARPGLVTVTDVRSNKVRYDENETATTVATIANDTGTPVPVKLTAKMILGLDSERPLTQEKRVLQPGQSTWTFGYNVGPETYGRAIEVRCLDEQGTTLDTWQEYYGVAAEWFRLQQHCGSGQTKTFKSDEWVTYFNQLHNFASEPTDWGVQVDMVKELEEYYSAQALYHSSLPARRARYEHERRLGVMGTFYQTFACSGQMGYEVMRQHPEFSLYDANGQFAVDPIYGGSPNPMELASPMEIGPKREVKKPYLDRKITSWQHSVMNYAMEDVVRYMAERIKEYAAFLNCNGVYVDGNVGVLKGLGYDGEPNVPSQRDADYVRLNARNHRVFSAILKAENPNFGTWYNWGGSLGDPDWCRAKGWLGFLGSGYPGDNSDENIRAAAVQNSMFLLEEQFAFFKGDQENARPAGFLKMLCDNRDQLMQKYNVNMVIGYMFPWRRGEDPGANRWGWPMLNYFGAQLIATQLHFAGGFAPSMRPWLQFQTRYSRYIWAPDVKVVSEPEKIVQVNSPEEIWWKRLIYRLDHADGYDLIVHLVRIPPTPKWDVDWLDEPAPQAAVTVQVSSGQDRLRDVWAVRPYDYEEPQQPVPRIVKAIDNGKRAEITVPEFRYHTMVVFRFAKGK